MTFCVYDAIFSNEYIIWPEYWTSRNSVNNAKLEMGGCVSPEIVQTARIPRIRLVCLLAARPITIERRQHHLFYDPIKDHSFQR